MYRIKAKGDIPEETIIDNTASIFFDFNPPIVTNTTENIMVSTFDADNDGSLLWEDCDDDNSTVYPGADEIPNNEIDEDCDGSDLTTSVDQLLSSYFDVFPNPTKNLINIRTSIPFNYQATLYDLSGTTIKQENNKNTINLSSVSNGIYFLEILDTTTGNRAIQKVIIAK